MAMADFDTALSPPENAVSLYRSIAETAGCPDPFALIKSQSTKMALGLVQTARLGMEMTADPLFAAIQLALAGNIIDYGLPHQCNHHEVIANSLEKIPAINDYEEFKHDLDQAKIILYLADNCGELVFDGLLIARLQKPVTLAVKEEPIINDALYEDCVPSGLEQLCRIVSNGTGCPGTPLTACSEEFLEIFRKADLIISKGQGNFETLSESGAPLYFLLTVKCEVVARLINENIARFNRTVKTGDTVLMKNRPQIY